CDPDIHKQYELRKNFDIALVAHLNTEARQRLAQWVHTHYPKSLVGQHFFGEMAKAYSASRIVLNLSIADDVNMRIFEAAACGSLLLTNHVPANGISELFQDGQELLTFRDLNHLRCLIDAYLTDNIERERIAATGRTRALEEHTYRHRMATLLSAVARQLQPAPPQADTFQHQKGSPKPSHLSNPTECLSVPSASIIIITHNQLSFTRQCVESIRRYTTLDVELIIIDNGSTDGTAEYLRAECGIRVLHNDNNLGFPAAVNQGLIASSGEVLVLLNNDTVVTQGWLDGLIKALDFDSHIGLVGPCSNGALGMQQVLPSYTDLAHLQEFAIAHNKANRGLVTGARVLGAFCLAIRRSVIEVVGLFEEAYGIGTYDDYDYCCRALQ
ncbi:MAG TPA: glycosyltransferase, partial [Burkholderiaceae bacterium]|nr:glycosyltransferase [Burkholderiaceae bacterium]